MPDIVWQTYFPRARSIELQMFPDLAEVEAAFATAGLRRVALVSREEVYDASLAAHAERLRHRAISTFEHMTEAEIREGFGRLDAAVARETSPRQITERADLLVLAAD